MHIVFVKNEKRWKKRKLKKTDKMKKWKEKECLETSEKRRKDNEERQWEIKTEKKCKKLKVELGTTNKTAKREMEERKSRKYFWED